MLPLWLVISACLGMWLYFDRQSRDRDVEQIRFATGVNEAGLKDDVGKFLTFVGERHTSSGAGVQGLTRAAAMIEGALGPGNAGYRVERIQGPATPSGRWPILMVTLRGWNDEAAPLWVIAGYDARPGSLGAELDASGTASVMAAASSLATAKPERPVVFAFLPHAYDPESPLLETFELFSQRARSASEVLVVESMGAAPSLVISSREAESRVFRSVGELGEISSAESICLEDDFDLSSTLFEVGLPAVRVATRPVVKADEVDNKAPEAAVHAAATKALVSLIERLSNS
ncbi:M28 family peptidase [Luteolibacter marinus]|uniref:M28 family peptidase n=1 Tax=Luteolibacter marinus TaxID=2776705 RepID=UPI001867AFA5|nr:M28 family peptidase [Luteolibacter marinus]